MTLGVVSDTHNRIINVEKIIDIFNDNNVTSVIHTGDITQGKTLQLFSRLNCPLIGVYGNNDLKELDLEKVAEVNGFDFQKPPLIKNIEGKDIAVFHEPDGIKDFIEKNSHTDLICHGHTHRYRNEDIGGVKIFNPGESAGILQGKNAVGIVELNTLKIRRIFF